MRTLLDSLYCADHLLHSPHMTISTLYDWFMILSHHDCFLRTQKKEHVDERLLSAYDLINEMVTQHAPNEPALITQSSVRDSQRKAAKKTARVKANNRYKENRVLNSRKKKSRKKTSLKAQSELYSTQTIPDLSVLITPAGTERGRNQNSDAPIYDYDVKQSARQFITRKSFENYQQRMSTSFDFDRSISLRRESPFQLSVDPRVDELIEDVSLGDPHDLQQLDHLDSLLSGDSELRDLLGDVISNKHTSRDLLGTRDDIMLTNSRTQKNRWRDPIPVESKREMLATFKMGRKENREDSYPEDILSGTCVTLISSNKNFTLAPLPKFDDVVAVLKSANSFVCKQR